MESLPLPELLKRKNIREFLINAVGSDAIDILQTLPETKEGILDETIANKISTSVTRVRTGLNRLHYYGLVDYQKIKDPNMNWYTYLWYYKRDKLLEYLVMRIDREIETIKGQIEDSENKLLFSCENRCDIFPFEIAAEYGFRCPECMDELKQIDMQEEIDKLKNRLDELEAEKQYISKLLQ